MKSRSYLERDALSWFYWATALGALFLIFLGGMVTTQGAGLAVPDWPLSFGSINPEGWWHIAAVRLEHGHRLVASMVGLLVMVAMIWSFARLRGSALPWWALAGFLAVAAQGVMGGFRVTKISLELAIAHGIFGQLTFALLVCLAVTFSSRWRPQALSAEQLQAPRILPWALLITVLVQLVVAATMRHYKAGLVIPDFPLSNGQLIPEFTSWLIAINFAHRVIAMVIAGLVIANAVVIWDGSVKDVFLKRAMGVVLLLVFVQICLGVFTVWSIRAPVPTTLHVTNGAMVLSACVVLVLRCAYLRKLAPETSAPASVPVAA